MGVGECYEFQCGNVCLHRFGVGEQIWGRERGRREGKKRALSPEIVSDGGSGKKT